MGVRMNYILIKLIEVYQTTPGHIHSNCRFIPTCSEYMKQSIIEYGSFKGVCLGLKRILRCRPFGKYGYDPVETRRYHEKN